MRKLEPTEAAYIAGFVDGEAWIGVSTYLDTFKRYEAPTLSIHQNDRSPLDWMVKVTGVGKVYRKKTGIHDYVVRQQDALDLLEAIEGYLIVKADQAGFILERFGR